MFGQVHKMLLNFKKRGLNLGSEDIGFISDFVTNVLSYLEQLCALFILIYCLHYEVNNIFK